MKVFVGLLVTFILAWLVDVLSRFQVLYKI